MADRLSIEGSPRITQRRRLVAHSCFETCDAPDEVRGGSLAEPLEAWGSNDSVPERIGRIVRDGAVREGADRA